MLDEKLTLDQFFNTLKFYMEILMLPKEEAIAYVDSQMSGVSQKQREFADEILALID